MTATTNDPAVMAYLGPITSLIVDEEVTEIMVNGDSSIYYEKAGRFHHFGTGLLSQQALRNAVIKIARMANKDIGGSRPMLSAKWGKSCRVEAAFPPVAQGGILLTIRKLRERPWDLDEMLAIGSITQDVVEQVLEPVIAGTGNLLISGIPGSGKSSLLGAVAARFPRNERIGFIEDTSELPVVNPNAIQLEEQLDLNVTIRSLVKSCLRHRLNRLILGEVRGEEAEDLLRALNSGMPGSIATIHANNARAALDKLASYVLMGGSELPIASINRQIAGAFSFVVHVRMEGDRRLVSEAIRVKGYAGEAGGFDVQTIYRIEKAMGAGQNA